MKKLLILGCAALWTAGPADAYIDNIEVVHPELFTLPMLLSGNAAIAVLRVERLDAGSGRILFEAVDWIKGKQEGLKFKHQVPLEGDLRNLKAGQKGVFFFGGDAGRQRAIMFLEKTWYLVAPAKEDPTWWTLFRVQRELKCCFMGTGEELAAALRKVEAEREVVVSCQKEPGDGAPLHRVRYFMDPKQARRLVPASGQSAGELLRELGGDAAVPRLVEKLKDKDPGVRGIALEALAKLGGKARDAAPAAAEALRDPERVNRWAAADALGAIGSEAAVPALVRAFTETYPMALEAIRRAAYRIDREGRILIPLVSAMLRSGDAAAQNAAAHAVRAIAPNLRVTVAMVRDTLRQPDGFFWLSHMNLASSRELAKADVGREAVPALNAALKDASAHTRITAMNVLTQLGAVDHFLPVLRDGLKDPHPKIRGAALSALCASRDEARAAAAVVEKLSDENPEVVVVAIQKAAWLGPKAEAGLPRLLEILKAGDPYHRFLTTGALAKICASGRPEHLQAAVPALAAALTPDPRDKDPYLGVPMVAAEALGNIGAGARAAAPALAELLKETRDDPYRLKLRLAAALALWKADRSSAGVVTAWLADLVRKTPYPGHRHRAIDILGILGPDARASIPALNDVLAGTPSPEIRGAAVEALKKIEGK